MSFYDKINRLLKTTKLGDVIEAFLKFCMLYTRIFKDYRGLSEVLNSCFLHEKRRFQQGVAHKLDFES